MPRPAKFPTDLLEAALLGLESKKTAIERSIQEVKAALGGAAPSVAADGSPRKGRKRHLSEEARARIAAAQRARWAKTKAKQKRAAK